MSTKYDEQLNQMYDAQLSSQKTQLQTNYETADAELAAKKEQAQKVLEDNISKTRTDAQRAAVANAEYYNAAGLSSGARAQARLSQDNQLLANITALRAAQQQSDADIDRQRTLLSKEYASAIAKAQAENDLARAQALYEEAKEEDQRLLAKQEAAAGIMAQSGDYSRYGDLYGLTPEEINKLSGASSSTPSYSDGSSGGSTVNNGGRTKAEVIAMQRALGVDPDGLWGPASQKAALARWGTTSADDAWAANNAELYAQYQSNQMLSESAWKKKRNALVSAGVYADDPAITSFSTYDEYVRAYKAYLNSGN